MKQNNQRNEILIVIIIALALFILFGGFGMMGFGGGSWMYGMMGNYGYGFGWIFGLLVSVVLIAVPILIIWILVKKLGEKR